MARTLIAMAFQATQTNIIIIIIVGHELYVFWLLPEFIDIPVDWSIFHGRCKLSTTFGACLPVVVHYWPTGQIQNHFTEFTFHILCVVFVRLCVLVCVELNEKSIEIYFRHQKKIL